ncbi:MAG: hypothetical protein BWK72_20840 [Rhodoferax ferrireducens]|uniref:DUF2339 domain-containing protein n=1 Tax=Rhodoferax ferrireducens TaxID=192843 RepID=A0A1W9KNK4_9BURK|nr:MAG: hypothetical protein BWK72_20840 [Rhodoferax ferrireducens]
MAVLGLILGVVLGAWLGTLAHAPFAGMVLGGVIGWLLLRGYGQSEKAPEAEAEAEGGSTLARQAQPVEVEIDRLRIMLENQQKRFERELAMLKQRISALESGGAKPADIAGPAEPEIAVIPTASVSVEAPAIAASVAMVKTQVEPAPQAEQAIEFVVEPEPVAPDPAPQPAPRVINEWKPEEAVRMRGASQPAAQDEPGLVKRAFIAAKDWLLGGNTLVRMGVVLVFIGLAFLLRYASDRVVVPVELRYLGVAASSLVFLVLGWWLRDSRRAYGLLMQGAAVAVMYLTIFAAMRLHPLLPMQGGFVLLVAVAALAAMLAVTQNALTLAVAGSLGGFAAPILASTGGGSHVALFSYFALLNTGILGIAWFKAWRSLNLVGFFGTFLIGLSWGLRSYRPEYYGSCQLFLILFFLMFVIIGLLFARRVLLDDPASPQGIAAGAWWQWVREQGGNLGRYVDGTLLFGPPLVGFGLQYALLKHTEYGAAFSALALGGFYLLLARGVYSRTHAALTLLVEVYLALGVIFATLAIPFGLDARWTTAAWAVEAAGIYWIGHRQGRPLGRAFALLLQTGAILAWFVRLQPGTETLVSGPVLGTLLIGLSLLANALSLRTALGEEKQTGCWDAGLRPFFNTLGLWFLYLIAPMVFKVQGTAIAWALAGLATVFIGLRLEARGWLINSLLVQLLAGVVFLIDTQHGGLLDAAGVRASHGSGWRGLIVSSLIGAAALASVFLAIRVARRNRDPALERRMGWLMLFGLGFMTLGALFVLPWASVTGIWAGCGFVLLVLALWLALAPAFWFALLLQAAAGVAYLLTHTARFVAAPDLAGVQIPAFAHSGFWTPTIIALAAFCVAWRLVAYARRELAEGALALDGEKLALPALIWSALWWAFAWWGELSRLLSDAQQGHVLLIVLAVTALLWNRVGGRLAWAAPFWLGSAILPLLVLFGLVDYLNHWHPFGEWGWLAFALVLTAHLSTLANADLLQSGIERAVRLAGVWCLLIPLSLEMRHLLLSLAEPDSAWRWLGWTLPLVGWLLWSSRREPPQGWPFAEQAALYRFGATFPLAGLLFAWVALSALKSAGDSAPLPFIPLANPLEIAQVLVLFAGWRWLANLREAHDEASALAGFATPMKLALYALAFIVYTMAVLRADHHIGGVAWQAEALLRSMPVQASLSLAWSLLAIGLMIAGHRNARRVVWIAGAALVAVVVAKLFFVELASKGGLERIVSFIGVGVLLLVVGYFAPLPPAREEEA